MGYRSLGRDSVRKGDKPLEWLERDGGDKHFHWEGLWGRHIPERYKKNRLDAFAQMGSDGYLLVD